MSVRPGGEALLDTLERFAATLTAEFGIGDVLHSLTTQIAPVLDVTGAGVILLQDARFTYATSPVEKIADLERVVERHQCGPCVDAVVERRAVAVPDLEAADPRRWPAYVAQARSGGICGVVAVPMFAWGRVLGALGLYTCAPRSWTNDDLRVAGILANIASSYLVHASELERRDRTVEQLQRALETRVVIEQAKGILAAEKHVTVDEAFLVLRKHARDNNARLHDVASAVVHLHMRM